MRKFDTKIQHLNYKVTREVAKLAWEDKLLENLMDIPEKLSPGKQPTMRCCVYKERAILAERVKLAMGGNKDNPNIIEVINIACDECPVGGFEVTIAFRGCLAHHCEDACKFGAITFDHQHVAHIDKSKCKECGACAKVCPKQLISILPKKPAATVPCHNTQKGGVARKICKTACIGCSACKRACEFDAITVENNLAQVDLEKCKNCGLCEKECPTGAIINLRKKNQ
jgi:ferredoxin